MQSAGVAERNVPPESCVRIVPSVVLLSVLEKRRKYPTRFVSAVLRGLGRPILVSG